MNEFGTSVMAAEESTERRASARDWAGVFSGNSEELSYEENSDVVAS